MENERLTKLLGDFAVDANLDIYQAPLLLARLGRFDEAVVLAETIPVNRDMCFQMLGKSLVEHRAPAEVIEYCLSSIDDPGRLKWALEDMSPMLGYQNRPSAAFELGDLMEGFLPRYRAMYWSGVARGLAWHARPGQE